MVGSSSAPLGWGWSVRRFEQVISFLPNVIVAIIILAVAGAISGAIAGAVAKTMGDTPTGKVVATAIPVLVLGIAVSWR